MNIESCNIEILCVQLLPVHLHPEQSMEKVNLMLSKYGKADILILPEMAFSGYSFDDRAEIQAILEEPNQNFPTFNWCASQAGRLGAYVFCGYPEKSSNDAYNSMMVISPEGSLIQNYRKKFLYKTDKTWALEGDSFKSISINIRGKSFKVGLGICMDINPYEFVAPFNSFELASFWLSENVDFCAFCTNWTTEDEDEGMQLLNYWVGRMKPLIKDSTRKKRYFMAADRIGEERGIRYMGNSCVLELGPECKLLARLGRYPEDVLKYSLRID